MESTRSPGPSDSAGVHHPLSREGQLLVRSIPADMRGDEGDEIHARALDVIEALQVLGSGVVIVSPDLRILSLNESLARTLNASAVTSAGRMLREVMPGRHDAPELEMISDTAHDGAPRVCCSLYGGRALEFRSHRLESGFVVVEVLDATQQASLEKRMDHLLESITDGFCVLDSRWRFTYWNGAAARMTGLRTADMVGAGVSKAFGNMVGSQLASRFMETLRRKTPTEIRSWSYGGDSQGRAAGIYDAFIYPVEGSGAVIIFREVGDRVRQEQELVERRADAEALHRLVRAIAAVNDSSELRQLLAQAAMDSCGARGSAVIEVNGSDGVITAAAGESMPLTGTRIPLGGSLTEQVIAAGDVVEVRDYSTAFPEHQARLMGQLMGPVLATPLVAHNHSLGVLVVSRARGSLAFVARSVDRLRVLADHAALGLWKLRLVDEAQAANHAKSDFMTAMSHELRTPLTALAGYAELLVERDAGPLSPLQIDVVQRMQSVTDHLAGLIDELLTYSSLDASVADEEVEHVRVLLGEVVQGSLSAVKPEADEKGISLDCEVRDDIALRTDPRRLQQILAHLLSNAVKFTERGHVRFRHVVEGGWVRLHIEDTGIGIAPEHRDRIFQPFTQLDSGLRRRHRGAGLGLFISRRLAAQIGGTIDYRSTVGKGTAFTVSIPA